MATTGVTANTEDGTTVIYKKRPLTGDKEKDQTIEEKPRQLYVSVEKGEGDGAEELRIARALREIYGDDE